MISKILDIFAHWMDIHGYIFSCGGNCLYIYLYLQMGPPPKYLIDRKLIRSISKKVAPKNPLIPADYFTGLMNCWKTFGVGSNKCVDQQLKYDFAQQETVQFKKKLQKMNIKQIVCSELQRPQYHEDVKGRHTAARRKNIGMIDLTNAIF